MQASSTLGSRLYHSSGTSIYLLPMSAVPTSPRLVFMVPHLALKEQMTSLMYLKRSIVHLILLLASMCLHLSCMLIICRSSFCSGRLHSIVYIYISPHVNKKRTAPVLHHVFDRSRYLLLLTGIHIAPCHKYITLPYSRFH